ncbi:MAG: hypothetical protein ACI8TP_001274 [Acidimicrobiales bacterium]|jgi:hypothetical protein
MLVPRSRQVERDQLVDGCRCEELNWCEVLEAGVVHQDIDGAICLNPIDEVLDLSWICQVDHISITVQLIGQWLEFVAGAGSHRNPRSFGRERSGG